MRFPEHMLRTSIWKNSFRSDFGEYLIAIFAIAGTAAICFPFKHIIGYQSIGLILLMVIAILSLFLGGWPLLTAAILNVLILDYFFQEPLFTFRVYNVHDLFANIADFIIALVAIILITRIRRSRAFLLKSKENQTILYNFLESLNDATSISDVVELASQGLKKQFGLDAVIYLKEKEGSNLLDSPLGDAGMHTYNGFAVASSLFTETRPVMAAEQGKGSDEVSWFSLRDSRGAIVMIGVNLKAGQKEDEEKLILLKSYITLIASTLGREIIIETAREKDISDQSEKLFQAILSSVSHELRTPISIITTAVDNLSDNLTSSDPEKRLQICNELESASIRLNNLVENILDMSRIESGMLKLNLQYCDIADLIGIVVKDMKAELQEHPLTISLPENLSLIRADISLIRQVFLNILRNAIMYTPQGAAVEIYAGNEDGGRVSVTIKDHGPGVPGPSLESLFKKFYRVPGSKSGGTGLGLAIARAFVEAHGGLLKASNHPEGGLSVSIFFKAEN
jgi:two-component system sensor histidine kinase KdpD